MRCILALFMAGAMLFGLLVVRKEADLVTEKLETCEDQVSSCEKNLTQKLCSPCKKK